MIIDNGCTHQNVSIHVLFQLCPTLPSCFICKNPQKLFSPIRGGCTYTQKMPILAYTLSHAVILQAFRACGNIVNVQIYLFIRIIQRDQGYGPSLVQVKPQQGPFILNNILCDVASPLPQPFQSDKYVFAYLPLKCNGKFNLIISPLDTWLF